MVGLPATKKIYLWRSDNLINTTIAELANSQKCLQNMTHQLNRSLTFTAAVTSLVEQPGSTTAAREAKFRDCSIEQKADHDQDTPATALNGYKSL